MHLVTQLFPALKSCLLGHPLYALICRMGKLLGWVCVSVCGCLSVNGPHSAGDVTHIWW